MSTLFCPGSGNYHADLKLCVLIGLHEGLNVKADLCNPSECENLNLRLSWNFSLFKMYVGCCLVKAVSFHRCHCFENIFVGFVSISSQSFKISQVFKY